MKPELCIFFFLFFFFRLGREKTEEQLPDQLPSIFWGLLQKSDTRPSA